MILKVLILKKELDNIINKGEFKRSKRVSESKIIFANSLVSSTKESPITFPGIGISFKEITFILLSRSTVVLAIIKL